MKAPSAAVRETVDELVAEVRTWPGVEVGGHRFGGTEFRLGSREIGHVHKWGMVDIAFLGGLRDALVETGATDVHHLLTESGWTTFYVRSPDDLEQARWLLRLSYLSHQNALERTGTEVPAVDVAAELDALAPSEAVRAAFERRPTRS